VLIYLRRATADEKDTSLWYYGTLHLSLYLFSIPIFSIVSFLSMSLEDLFRIVNGEGWKVMKRSRIALSLSRHATAYGG